MSVRLLRLQSDYEAVRRLARLHPRIEVEGVSGNPPEKYRLIYRVRSVREEGDRILVAKEHRVEVVLPRTYPRDAPLCRMLTPVFHPNIAPHAICIGDHWSAAESLDLMLQRIGEMLAFQSYNVKSPLNGTAAQWVEEKLERLPLDPEEFFVDLDTEARDEPAAGCANCGAGPAPHGPCAEGHLLCADCAVTCETCGRPLCLLCDEYPCRTCPAPA